MLGIRDIININIIDISDCDMMIGYDWLVRHNPAIDWQAGRILSREPVHKVAGVR